MPRLDPAQWEEVLRRIADGAPVDETARAFSIHPSTLSKRLGREKSQRRKARKAAPRRASKPGTRSTVKSADPEGDPTADVAARRPARKAPALAVRRQLVNRLYRAIDTKLKLMERRMHSEITALDEAKPEDASSLTAADHERETRAFGALVKTINSVRQLQAELDDIANANPNTTAADARLAADADRYRRDIAERLAKFVPPQP
jgi:hypothetical protein